LPQTERDCIFQPTLSPSRANIIISISVNTSKKNLFLYLLAVLLKPNQTAFHISTNKSIRKKSLNRYTFVIHAKYLQIFGRVRQQAHKRAQRKGKKN
jgi:hypothetical protein